MENIAFYLRTNDMDVHLNKNMTLILNIIVIGATFCLLFHTSKFSIGLFLLSCTYVAIVLIRDYVLKIALQGASGMRFLYVQLGLALVICVWSESFFSQIYLLILIGEFTFHHSKKHAIIFTTVNYACILLGVLIYRQFPPFEQIYLIIPRVIDFFAIFGMSLLAKIAFQQKNQLVIDNEHLRIASIALEQKAKLQERTRISRDIHDSVGHTLTSALTGLQTAAHALDKNHYPLAKEMIDRTKESILRGLDDVRSSVHVLRANFPDHSFIPELIRLIDDTKKQTNVEIAYTIDTITPDLSPIIELTIYRALQEGLTNGIRHGFSTYFRFSLTYYDEVIRFVLSNNAHPPVQIVFGYGLNAMKERVEDVGGAFSISNKGSSGGVTLDITIPFSRK
jgi:signal transduction histidine kinase